MGAVTPLRWSSNIRTIQTQRETRKKNELFTYPTLVTHHSGWQHVCGHTGSRRRLCRLRMGQGICEAGLIPQAKSACPAGNNPAGKCLRSWSKMAFRPGTRRSLCPAHQAQCRFGLYHCIHRLVFKHAGVDEAIIFSPNQDSNFYSHFVKNFNGAGPVTFMKDIWTSIVGIDLLYKLILRLRNLAIDTRQAQQVYENCVQQWTRLLEKLSRFSDRGLAF